MSKTVVIADCHGRTDLIENAIKDCPDYDRLIFAGDFVDIGPEPEQCLELLLDLNARILWGNHDLAVLLGERIHPSGWHSPYLVSMIADYQDLFKVADNVDDVLVTHAGLSQAFWREYNFLESARCIAKKLNSLHLREVWKPYGPLWYRPNTDLPPHLIKQVCGHTPPGYISKYYPDFWSKFPNFRVVDPYSERDFGPTRFRYVLIEDGEIAIHDSGNQNL